MTSKLDSFGLVTLRTSDPSVFGLMNCSPPQTALAALPKNPTQLSVFSLNFRHFHLDPNKKSWAHPWHICIHILLSRLPWQVICNVETMGHLQCDGCHRLTVADYFSKYFWPSNTKPNANSEPSTVLTILTLIK